MIKPRDRKRYVSTFAKDTVLPASLVRGQERPLEEVGWRAQGGVGLD